MTSMPSDNFIYLNAYKNMNLLSSEFILGLKSGVALANPAICGARLSSGDGKPWYGLYLHATDNNLKVDLRDIRSSISFPSDRSKFKLVVDNPPTSPYTASINNGETTVSQVWTSSRVIPHGMSLFNNIPDGTTQKMSFNYTIKIGEIKFRDYDGVCVGYYIPVTNSAGKIGMYDVVSGKFCTATTATAVTVDNQGCLYTVGNW